MQVAQPLNEFDTVFHKMLQIQQSPVTLTFDLECQLFLTTHRWDVVHTHTSCYQDWPRDLEVTKR